VQVDEREFVDEHEKMMEQTEDMIARALALHKVENITGEKRKVEGGAASSSVTPLKLWGDEESSDSDDEEEKVEEEDVSDKAKGKKRARN
jgi:hypothetical protein